MDDHFFRALHPHLSKKEYKFQQRKSAPSDSQGECLAVCLMWIKEKISTNRFSLFRNSAFSAAPGNEHLHNLGIMQRAQALGGHESSNQLAILEDGLGLEHDTGIPAVRRVRRNSQDFDVVDSLIALLAELQPGTAACAEIYIGNMPAGHAVAVYRSRSGTLHFFDPNCGVYKIEHTGGFLQAWYQGCLNRGWLGMQPSVRPGQAQTNWSHFYPRR